MMIGMAIVVALLGVMSTLFAAVLGYIDKSLGSDFLVMPTSIVLSSGNIGAGPELAQAIAETPGVASVTTLRQASTQANGADLQLVGIDPVTYPAVSGLEFSAGEAGAAYAALQSGRAVIANGIYAAQHQVQVGDTLVFKTPEGDQNYEVVGIAVDYLNAKIATGYISQANLAADFHQLNDVLFLVNGAAGVDQSALYNSLQQMIDQYPAFTLLNAADWREEQEQIFNGAGAMLYTLMGLLALPSLIALINTLGINVIERTREIGMLRAVGGTRQQVRRLILIESLLLAIAGTAFGILAGVWLGYVLVEAMNSSGFVLAYAFPYAGVLTAVALGLIFGIIASLLPARQAARLDIVQALRYE
jgi:putative ABC transport system permease protein